MYSQLCKLAHGSYNLQNWQGYPKLSYVRAQNISVRALALQSIAIYGNYSYSDIFNSLAKY